MPEPSQSVTHILVGTKAQFIKMAPVAWLLQERDWPYRLLDLGQHGAITPGIVRDFGLRADHVHVLRAGETVATYGQALRWTAAAVSRIASSRIRLRRSLVRNPAGVALIHGDTLSTLFGLYLSRRLGLKVGLVEAGLSSGSLFDPFPEEMLRRHAEKRVDYLFAPDGIAAQRLERKKVRGAVVNTGYNTGRDALLLIAQRHAKQEHRGDKLRTVFTLHRAETISRTARLRKLIEHVMRLAPSIAPVRFYLHDPTCRALKKARLLDGLHKDPHFELVPLGTYPEFTRALVAADFILTDGGSIQEEASYLGKKCLLLRRRTERNDGMGSTAMLTTMDAERDLEFLRSEESKKSEWGKSKPSFEASRAILDCLYRPS